jgi:hypothetical protein
MVQVARCSGNSAARIRFHDHQAGVGVLEMVARLRDRGTVALARARQASATLATDHHHVVDMDIRRCSTRGTVVFVNESKRHVSSSQ